MTEWRYVKPLTNKRLIMETESKLGFKFSKSYTDFVKEYNGGRPPIYVFNTDITKERTIKSFLSLNPSDVENIIKLNEFLAENFNNVIAFAIDPFGNYICFDKTNGSIIFLDYETGEEEKIADTFDEFLDMINE